MGKIQFAKKNFTSFTKKNIVLLLLLLVLACLAGIFFLGGVFSYAPAYRNIGGYYESLSTGVRGYVAEKAVTSAPTPQQISPSEYRLKIKEGTVGIKSKNPYEERKRIEEKAREYGGYVEHLSRAESKYEVSLSLTLRLPADSFDEFVEWLVDNFEIESCNVRMYTVSVFLTKTEVDVLEDAMKDFESYSKDFDELMERAKEGNITPQLLEVMWKIIEKKKSLTYEMTDLQKRINSLRYRLAEESSELAKLTVNLIYKKPVKVVDKDFTRELAISVKELVENAVRALKDITVGTLILFLNLCVLLVHGLVYVIVGLIGFAAVYKLVIFFRKKFFVKRK